jgi:hypothetical protein
MPALDYINKTAETKADISAGAEVATTAVENSRAGFAKGAGFTVVVTVASTANFNTDLVRTLNFYLDISLDNGSSYHPIGVAAGQISEDGVPKQVLWGPVEKDIVPENYTPANIQWRGRANWTNVLASTADFNFQFYLGNQNIGIPGGLQGNGIS